MNKLAMLTVAAALLLSHPAYAASIKVPVNHVSAEGIGQEMGTVTFEDAPGGGLDILVDLSGLSKGEHGMHVHENPTCAPAAGKDGKTMIQPKAANTQALKKPAIWVTYLL